MVLKVFTDRVRQIAEWQSSASRSEGITMPKIHEGHLKRLVGFVPGTALHAPDHTVSVK
jgi:hypothetical protein